MFLVQHGAILIQHALVIALEGKMVSLAQLELPKAEYIFGDRSHHRPPRPSGPAAILSPSSGGVLAALQAEKHTTSPSSTRTFFP